MQLIKKFHTRTCCPLAKDLVLKGYDYYSIFCLFMDENLNHGVCANKVRAF